MTQVVHEEGGPSAGGLIAIVDDDPLVRSATSTLLRSLNYECRVFASAEDLLREGLTSFACVLSDIQMPGMSGIALAQHVHASEHDIPVILMTGHPSERAASLCALGLVSRLLEKPLNGALLYGAVEEALGERRA